MLVQLQPGATWEEHPPDFLEKEKHEDDALTLTENRTQCLVLIDKLDDLSCGAHEVPLHKEGKYGNMVA